jgi:hypothetical protein
MDDERSGLSTTSSTSVATSASAESPPGEPRKNVFEVVGGGTEVLALAGDEQHQGLDASQPLEALTQLERQRAPHVTVGVSRDGLGRETAGQRQFVARGEGRHVRERASSCSGPSPMIESVSVAQRSRPWDLGPWRHHTRFGDGGSKG